MTKRVNNIERPFIIIMIRKKGKIDIPSPAKPSLNDKQLPMTAASKRQAMGASDAIGGCFG